MSLSLYLLWLSCFACLLGCASFLYPQLQRSDITEQALNAPARFFRPTRHRRSGGIPKPPWVRKTIVNLYAEGGMSYREVMHTFNRLHAHQGVTVCLDTVYRWVQKYHSEMDVVRKATRNRFPPCTPANSLWCIDGTGKQDVQGIIHFILGILDHGTRRNLALVRLAQANAMAILQEISKAAEQFGKPTAIRTDNASVFHSAVFQQGIAALGIRHTFIAPGKPWQNRIERFFLTLKLKLNQIVPQDGVALDQLLTQFSDWYNQVRPHLHLHGLTPMEVWTGVNPYKTAPTSVQRFIGWNGLLRGFYIRH